MGDIVPIKPDGLLGNDRTANEDLRLFRRALRNGWPISKVDREQTLSKLRYLLENADDERVQVSAAKTLAELNRQNITLDLAIAQADADANRPAQGNVDVKVVVIQPPVSPRM